VRKFLQNHLIVQNIIHHFDIPEPHTQLTIIADALVDVDPPLDLPEALDPESWRELDGMIEQDDYWDMLMPSPFARTSPELEEFVIPDATRIAQAARSLVGVGVA